MTKIVVAKVVTIYMVLELLEQNRFNRPFPYVVIFDSVKCCVVFVIHALSLSLPICHDAIAKT